MHYSEYSQNEMFIQSEASFEDVELWSEVLQAVQEEARVGSR